jgi:hypothetical protein
MRRRLDAGEDAYVDTGQHNGTQRVTIKEAATRLGVTEGAIRKRVQRGSIQSEMGDDGRVYVYLDPYQDASYPESQGDRQPLVEELRDRVRSLERLLDEERVARTEERRRHDTLMAQLMQRIPELEAPHRPEQPREGAEPQSATRGPHGAAERPFTEEEEPRRSWWREFFGFGG